MKTFERIGNWALVGLGVLCGLLLSGLLDVGSATGQAPAGAGGAGGGGLVASPAVSVQAVQIARDRFGLAIVDSDFRSLLVYEFVPVGDARTPQGIQLFAARKWRDDRELESFNNLEPTPDQVRRTLLRPGP